jgi:diguanylate cyclase (GGDEF)-like protein
MHGTRVAEAPVGGLLSAVLDAQTAIAGGDLDLQEVVQLVADRTVALTAASGCLVELAPTPETIRRAWSGDGAQPPSDGDAPDLSVPIVHRGQAVGTLSLFSPREGGLDEADAGAARFMASLVASGLMHASPGEGSSGAGLHDPLTGLPNRALFVDRLELALRRMRRDAPRPTLLVFDLFHLHGFDHLDDRIGREARDEVMVELASRLAHAIRDVDTAARLENDELVVLLEGAEVEAVLGVTGRLRSKLRRPVETSAGQVTVGIGIGAATAAPEDSPDSLLSRAESAVVRPEAR